MLSPNRKGGEGPCGNCSLCEGCGFESTGLSFISVDSEPTDSTQSESQASCPLVTSRCVLRHREATHSLLVSQKLEGALPVFVKQWDPPADPVIHGSHSRWVFWECQKRSYCTAFLTKATSISTFISPPVWRRWNGSLFFLIFCAQKIKGMQWTLWKCQC